MNAELPTADVPVAVAGEPGLEAPARRLARELTLPLAPADDKRIVALLVLMSHRIELRWHGPNRFNPTRVDLTQIDTVSGHGRSLRQPLARAAGLKKGDPWRPEILDATAGFGEDAWLLASLGCTVMAVERSPVIALLLADGLRQAAQQHPKTAKKMTLCHADSIKLLEKIARPGSQLTKPDVICLDPMFPTRKGGGASPKHIQILRHIAGIDPDSQVLWEAAVQAARRRVVVKRPLHAPPLVEHRTAAVHKAKGHRFDVYVPSTKSPNGT